MLPSIMSYNVAEQPKSNHYMAEWILKSSSGPLKAKKCDKHFDKHVAMMKSPGNSPPPPQFPKLATPYKFD